MAFSIVVPRDGSPGITNQLPTWIPLLVGVAVVKSVRSCGVEGAGMKWPNDVLLNGSKVAGLLNEMSAETDRVNYVVLGIGVNLNMQSDQFPEALRYPATSLAITKGSPVSRLEFTRSLLQEIDALYQVFQEHGSAPVFAAWTELCDMTGKAVRVDCNNLQIEGVMTGLADDGALLVRTATGMMERVYAGDVRPA